MLVCILIVRVQDAFSQNSSNTSFSLGLVFKTLFVKPIDPVLLGIMRIRKKNGL